MESAPDNEQTLAVPPDDRERSADDEQLSMFGRAGQLALPGAVAQLGLDGVAYAPDPVVVDDPSDSDRSPERASSSLGSHTPFCNSADPQANPPPAQQLALDLDAWDDAPQLSLWGRLAVQREVLAFSEWDRYSKCGWVRFKTDGDVEAKRRDSGAYTVGGVIRCGYPGCPWCGMQLAQQRAAELGAVMEKHLDTADTANGVQPDCWMLSPTIPHYATDDAGLVVEQLYAAHALLLRSREWREFRERWGLLTNGVRCLDAVAGGHNGLHAHFHIALFPTKAGLPTSEAWKLDLADKTKITEWTIPRDGSERFVARFFDGMSVSETGDDVIATDLATQLRTFGLWRGLHGCSKNVREKFLDGVIEPLRDAWERCCDAVGVVIKNREAFRATALKLSPSENAASYFVSWMLEDEVTRSVVKDYNPLRLLDAIKAGVKGAAYTYKQFRRAVDGRQWVTGLTDLRKRLNVSDEDVQRYADERRRRREAELEKAGTPVVKKRELQLVVRAHVFAAVHRIGWDAVFEFIDATELQLARGELLPPVSVLQRELDDFLWSHLGDSGGSCPVSGDVGDPFA